MRVLVTRPETSAASTAEKLAALGHQALLLPLAKPVHNSAIAEMALAQEPGAVAVTSGEALRALTAESIESNRDIPLFCVGNATARVAKDLGFRRVISGSGTGRELAKIVVDANPGNLLYLAGRPRSQDFEQLLAQAQVPFRTVEIYEMIAINHDATVINERLRRERPEVILLYSRETARRFFDLADIDTLIALKDLRFLCMSAYVAGAVPDGVGEIEIAEEPSERALMALV
ncbi:uroporphyrinogen-III synthase [Pararhizobium capsulatum DSM 1112]|uniref:Uroporphyrinogen-III synthase n=1 Tax=Pararhizobium capsulatum DSM 1112 TaxID=1121113 RepID=A0ABU0BI57_9HYPH|nr:uroporphyrinogen-III synthase [Pararhizobium capsulatum]MDQ0317943.1 uroporphyrinogen-III synthase [Pararhizobium capsulatum DSM 1112]